MDESKLKFCRVYRGESEFKGEDNNYMLWSAEKDFVEQDAAREASFVDNYLEAGLAGSNYDLPISLLATLFAYYSHNSDEPIDLSAAYFRLYFLPDYLQLTL